MVGVFFVLSLIVGGGTMSSKLFTIQEQKILKNNKWVKSVTEKSISFTEAFKLEFLNQYNLGKLPRNIFEEYGFNVSILGIKRIEQCTARFKKQNKRIEGFTDQRPLKSGQFKESKPIDKDDEIELLKKKNAELQQELEFLKKMEFLARQAQLEKSKQ